ncbi:hypothetical protein V4U86_04370 [Mycobacterium sp. AMU20-3851]|uniref:hypothetical protein n=1 Tax=Mycobacterium sp. AMU20-3851 TaxID=3122055 RepID=UPI003754BAFC
MPVEAAVTCGGERYKLESAQNDLKDHQALIDTGDPMYTTTEMFEKRRDLERAVWNAEKKLNDCIAAHGASSPAASAEKA